MPKRRQVPGRCANCGKRWKRGQPTKQYCSAYCRQAAWWERKFYQQLREASAR